MHAAHTLCILEFWGLSLIWKASHVIAFWRNVLDGLDLKICCILIYDPILVLLPLYPLTFIKQKSTDHYNLWPQDIFLAVCRKSQNWTGGEGRFLNLPLPPLETRCKKTKKLDEPVLLDIFKTMLNDWRKRRLAADVLSDLSFCSSSQCWQIFVCMEGCSLSVENILIVLLPVW